MKYSPKAMHLVLASTSLLALATACGGQSGGKKGQSQAPISGQDLGNCLASSANLGDPNSYYGPGAQPGYQQPVYQQPGYNQYAPPSNNYAPQPVYNNYAPQQQSYGYGQTYNNYGGYSYGYGYGAGIVEFIFNFVDHLGHGHLYHAWQQYGGGYSSYYSPYSNNNGYSNGGYVDITVTPPGGSPQSYAPGTAYPAGSTYSYVPGKTYPAGTQVPGAKFSPGNYQDQNVGIMVTPPNGQPTSYVPGTQYPAGTTYTYVPGSSYPAGTTVPGATYAPSNIPGAPCGPGTSTSTSTNPSASAYPTAQAVNSSMCGQSGVYCDNGNGNEQWPAQTMTGGSYDQNQAKACLQIFRASGYNTAGQWNVDVRTLDSATISTGEFMDNSSGNALIIVNSSTTLTTFHFDLMNSHALYCVTNVDVKTARANSCHQSNAAFGGALNPLAAGTFSVVPCN